MTKEQIVLAATPFVVPLLTLIAKLIYPKIPKKWVPVLCTFLGVLSGTITDIVSSGTIGTGTAFGAGIGVFLGAAGVGLREIKDQWTKDSTNGGGTAASVLVALLMAGSLMGCAMVRQEAETKATDGSVKMSLVKGYTVFQSGQTLAKAQAQNGEVQRVGMAELDQKSDAALFVQALGPLIEKAAAGAAMGMTGYGGLQTPRIVYVTNTIIVPAGTNDATP